MQSAEQTDIDISEVYEIKSKILSTRTADLFVAVEKTSGSETHLWKLREKLPEHDGLIAEFKNRLRALFKLRSELGRFEIFGIDKKRVAYAVIPPEGGAGLTGGKFQIAEAAILFGECIQKIAYLHEKGILCGDLCNNSYWLDKNQRISFIGIMGSLEMSPPKLNAEGNPVSNYLAPEQIDGSLLALATDVFALGVLGFYLFTGKYPARDKNDIAPLADSPTLPPPCKQVIEKCLKTDINERFSNAIDLATDYQKVLKDIVKSDPNGKSKISNELGDGNPPLRSGIAAKILGLVLFAVIIAVGFVVAMPIYTQYRHKSALELSVEPHRAVASANLNQLISELFQVAENPEKRNYILNAITESEDPIAHAMLVAVSQSTGDVDFRNSCQKVIIERARRSGMTRSAAIVGSWLGKVQLQPNLPGYANDVLMVVDGSLPADVRSKTIRRIYAENNSLALYLAAAAAIDSNNAEDYRELLAQLIGDKLQIDKIKSRGALALIISSSSLSDYFGRDVLDRLDTINDADLLVILQTTSSRDDGLTNLFAQECQRRNLIHAPRSYLLRILAERTDLPSDVLKSIAKGVFGKLEPQDIGSFGRWYDGSLEKILLTLLASEDDEEVRAEIYDTMASRELSHKFSSRLMKWVRDNHWEQRAQFAQSIASLALADEYADIEIDNNLASFDKYVSDKSLLGALISSENTRVVVAVLNRYKQIVPISNLLILLADPNKEIRMAALSAAARTNEVGALQYVIKSYNAETDIDVRKAYEEKFWVIKQRLQK
jgi:serine/threonine protein kinase